MRVNEQLSKRPIVFGEVLFDSFKDQRVLGGAPFNVAWNLKGIGLAPHFITAVGDDPDGETVKLSMRRWGMDITGIQTQMQQPTGVVHVELNAGQPSYQIEENVAYDFVEPIFPPDLLQQCPLFYHGSLAFRSDMNRKTIQKAQEMLHCARFLDMNIRKPHFNSQWTHSLLDGLDHLKLNSDELALLCGRQCGSRPRRVEDEVEISKQCASILRNRHGICQFWITMGDRGAMWIGKDQNSCFEPALLTGSTVDTVGAGDAFAAVVMEAIIMQRSPSEALHRGNRLAGKVCGIRGATTDDATFYHEGT
jgi:fructokinase